MVHRRLLAALAAVAVTAGASLALAHRTGHESRVVADCQRLPSPERQACIQCVSRPNRHHYHPDYPAGARCRPDNGRP